ncbi:MAG: hypothetical protein ACOC7P_00550 [Chloroflexota bacterium]
MIQTLDVKLSAPEIIKVQDSIDVIYEEFYRNGWTDGLPIIPPTKERVAAMMAGVNRAPEEIVGVLPPRGAGATIEKIAINAVMAGCLPSYMPVIVAAVEGIADPEFGLSSHAVTTSAISVMLVINGPVRHEAEINDSWGVFGPGWRANASIGRAISLIQLNIGGRIPGTVCKSVIANPERYTCCIGEREEVCGWEPFHVQRGFKRDESTVTVVPAQHFISLEVGFEVPTPEHVIQEIATHLHIPGVFSVYPRWGAEIYLIFCPDYAQTLERGGYTKESVAKYLWEHTMDIPSYIFTDHIYEQMCKADRNELPMYGSRKALIEKGVVQTPNKKQVSKKGIALAPNPDVFKIIVSGGDGRINGAIIPCWGLNARSITRRIEI